MVYDERTRERGLCHPLSFAYSLGLHSLHFAVEALLASTDLFAVTNDFDDCISMPRTQCQRPRLLLQASLSQQESVVEEPIHARVVTSNSSVINPLPVEADEVIHVNGSSTVEVGLEDLHCLMCKSVMIEPLLLPCGHEMCHTCLSGSASNCPCCKQSLAVKIRRLLLNQDKWSRIQTLYPDYTARCLARTNQQIAVEDADSTTLNHVDHAPLLEDTRVEDEEAMPRPISAKPLYISQMSGGGNTLSRKRTSTWLNQFLAKHSSAQHFSDGSVCSSPELGSVLSEGGLFLRRPPMGADLRCDSVDSIGPEVNIFAPIEPCPCTPTKRPSVVPSGGEYSFDEEVLLNSYKEENVEDLEDNDSIVRPTATRDGESNATKENQNGDSATSLLVDIVAPLKVGQRSNGSVLGAWVLPEASRKRPAVPVPRSGKRSKTAIGTPSAISNGKQFMQSNRGMGARSLLDFVVMSPPHVASGERDESERESTRKGNIFSTTRCNSSDSSSASERCSSTPGMSTPSSCGPEH